MDDCVYCSVLKQRLQHDGVRYEEVKDQNIIKEKGFATLPRLEVGGEILDFNTAIAWLNERGK
jgi:glutaredoxin